MNKPKFKWTTSDTINILMIALGSAMSTLKA